MLLAAYHCLELYVCISVNGASCHESDIEDLIEDSAHSIAPTLRSPQKFAVVHAAMVLQLPMMPHLIAAHAVTAKGNLAELGL